MVSASMVDIAGTALSQNRTFRIRKPHSKPSKVYAHPRIDFQPQNLADACYVGPQLSELSTR
jgi:hypothetical protein